MMKVFPQMSPGVSGRGVVASAMFTSLSGDEPVGKEKEGPLFIRRLFIGQGGVNGITKATLYFLIIR